MRSRRRRNASGEAFATGAGVEILTDLIDSEYSAESARKNSLESRTQFIVTSSGAFVTVLLGIGGFAIKAHKTLLYAMALCVIIAAILAFMGAASLCLKANNVLVYQHVDFDDVEQTLAHEWVSLGRGRARILATKARISALRSARANNDRKAKWIAWAIRLEIAAIVLVATAGCVTVIGVLIK